MTRLVEVLIVVLTADLSVAFWDDVKMDCGVSVWSQWGKASAGVLTRSRNIWRHPQNGGAPCPHLNETDLDPWTITDPVVKATKMTHSLVSGAQSRLRCSSCTIKPRDFLYIIDMSGSIGSSNFERAKKSLSKLIGKICGDIGHAEDNNRVAAITYSNTVVENFDFAEHSTTKAAQDAVERIPYKGGMTCTGTALNYGQTMYETSNGVRPDMKSVKEVVLFTDGMANCGPDQVQAALNLRELPPPKTLFVFAIGNSRIFNESQINAIASSPPSGHLYSFINFIEFDKVIDEVLKFPSNCVPIEIGK